MKLKLGKFLFVTEDELDKERDDFLKEYYHLTVQMEEAKQEKFQEGVEHVMNKVSDAIAEGNINIIYKINYPKINQIKQLANGLLGAYVRKGNG